MPTSNIETQTPRARVARLLAAALARCVERGTLGAAPAEWALEDARQDDHGDYATNVALGLARQEKRAPRAIAEDIATALRAGDDAAGLLSRVEVAGPGFINLFLADDVWLRGLGDVFARGADFGRGAFGAARPVNVEYVSANPTGPLHVGHGRGAVVGDMIAALLDWTGHRVTREFYINDSGRQMELLGASLHARYLQALGHDAQVPEDGYQGDYLIPLGRDLATRHLAALADRPDGPAVCGEYGYEVLLARLRGDLQHFNVHFDVWSSERALHRSGALERGLDRLRAAGHLYELDGAQWFRSTALGDDKDRVVVRREGAPTYFAADIAYHLDKFERGHSRLINIWGADHHGYIPRMQAAVSALGHPAGALQVVICQMVSVLRNGQPVQMSKRAGEFVTLREVLDEVGIDAARFFFVLRRPDAQLEFDLELAKKQSLDNPVYYVQYGHARIASILRRALASGMAVPAWSPEAARHLTLPEERDLARRIARFPEMIEGAARALEPHRVVTWLQETIGAFHSYYTRYKKTEKVVSADAERTRARLLLCLALKQTLQNALRLLGVSAPESMYMDAAEDDDG